MYCIGKLQMCGEAQPKQLNCLHGKGCRAWELSRSRMIRFIGAEWQWLLLERIMWYHHSYKRCVCIRVSVSALEGVRRLCARVFAVRVCGLCKGMVCESVCVRARGCSCVLSYRVCA